MDEESGTVPAQTAAMFWGEEEFLLREAAHDFLRAHGARATEVDARDWQGGETSDLATPSLFGELRALLLTNANSLPESGSREVRGYLAAPAPDAVLAMTAISRGKAGPAMAKAVQAAGGLVRQVAMRRQDLPGWVMDRARRRGVKLTSPAAPLLIGAVGDDPAALDQAVEQLATAFARRTIGPEEVNAQFRGLGERRVWDLCDRALAGRLGEALVILRSLLSEREEGLVILGGIASRVRDLIRVRALPERMPLAQAAKAAGLRFDWQVRRYREQAARFSPEELSLLHARLGEADRAIKGGAPDEVVLPGLVAALAGRPDLGALNLPERIGR